MIIWCEFLKNVLIILNIKNVDSFLIERFLKNILIILRLKILKVKNIGGVFIIGDVIF